MLSRCLLSEDSSHLAFLFQESSLSSESQPHESSVTWCLSGPAAGRFWMWDISEPQNFWVSAPQPELLALPRDSLYTQALKGQYKVSLKDIKLRSFMIIIVCLRDSLGPSAGLCHFLQVSTEPHLFIKPRGGFKNGLSQMWAFSKCESFSSIFAFSRGSGTWHLFSFLLPSFRNIGCHASV